MHGVDEGWQSASPVLSSGDAHGDGLGSASAAVRGRDGKLHAQEVHIFPNSLRGAGEDHRPMDQPEQTMTNATVYGVADGAATTGRTLRLRYLGGEQSI